MSITPAHTHDCNYCKHLGTVMFKGNAVDLYHCQPNNTFVLRHGSDGPDYSAMNGKMVIELRDGIRNGFNDHELYIIAMTLKENQ